MDAEWRQRLEGLAADDTVGGYVLPAVLSIGLMTGAYLAVGLVILVRKDVAFSEWFGILALVGMLVVPQFLVGGLAGYVRGVSLATAAAIGVAPLVVFLLSLAVVGGPVLSPLGAPLLTASIVVGWTVVAMAGSLAGNRVKTARSKPTEVAE